MNEQEYKHIRNLAWDLLIDANISQLPVDINAIASLYHLQHLIDNSKSLYDNTLRISEGILKIFGMKNPEFTRYLAVRILAPMIVFKELGIQSAEELGNLSGLPANLANQRFKRFEMLLSRNAFQTSRLETIVLLQFQNWIDNY
ncbi:MAG: hypothetical protein SPE24_08360 [Erysipelotrichaceae bacterium]|nr:hypothetical protein [Erysipelotrichaceae bacterium]